MQKNKYFIPGSNFIPASWPRVETFIPGLSIVFFPYNRNFSFVPGWTRKIPFIQKIIFIKTFNSVNRVEISSGGEKFPYNPPLNLDINYDEISIITIRGGVDILKFGTLLTKKLWKAFMQLHPISLIWN